MKPDSIDLLYPTHWIDIAGGVETILTILAILFGGIWAYFKFLRGRAFKERLEVTATGAIHGWSQLPILEVEAVVRNVGLSKVNLSQEGAGLRILAPAAQDNGDVSEPESMDWEWIGTEPVFADHDWVEPGETVADNIAFQLPNDWRGPVRLELTVASGQHTWHARSIVTRAEVDDG